MYRQENASYNDGRRRGAALDGLGDICAEVVRRIKNDKTTGCVAMAARERLLGYQEHNLENQRATLRSVEP